MGTKQLTLNQKVKFLAIIILRDFPNDKTPVCFYCEQRFLNKSIKWKRVFDHLDCNDSHNYPENLVLAHAYCNEVKKYKVEWQMIALEKLKDNIRRADSESLGEREGEKKSAIHTETNMEIDTNVEFSRITNEFLTDCLKSRKGNPSVETELDFKEALDTVTYRCFKENTHASQNTLRRIIDMFCCPEADFEKIKKNGRFVIRRRNGS